MSRSGWAARQFCQSQTSQSEGDARRQRDARPCASIAGYATCAPSCGAVCPVSKQRCITSCPMPRQCRASHSTRSA
eukprot:3160820-Rhodomonas_salina.5